jgi:DNA-binding NtrC family response regulator
VGCFVRHQQRSINNVAQQQIDPHESLLKPCVVGPKSKKEKNRAQMSAQLSNTASIVDPEKETTTLSSRLRDTNLSLANPHSSGSQSNGGAEVMSVGDCLNPTAYLQSMRLLVVDENDQVRRMCREVAERLGFVVEEATTIPTARKIIQRKDTAIVILDLTLPEGKGPSFVAEMKSLCPNTLWIGMSASATIASAVETMRTGASDYLSKPFPPHVLVEAFEQAAKRLCFDAERRKLHATNWPEVGDALGKSQEMEGLYRTLSNVARSTHPVMIVGEIGSGKELVARSIHSNGSDSSKPLISLNCKSMSSSLLEAELFGGLMSTSGEAGAQRRGLLASLGGGTVFLDEIDGLTLDLQGRLVRALKERKMRQESWIRMQSVSVRIIAATSQDLVQLVNNGSFRMDLYSLLSIVNLKIPPLRGRRSDIALLAQRFLERIGHRSGTVRTLSQETLRMLEGYDWPGNTLELEHAITYAVSLSSGPELEVNDLPQNILAFSRKIDAADRKSDLASSGKPRKDVVTFATMERQAIARALQFTKGDKQKAARLLGIGKTTLYRKFKEYGLDVEFQSKLPLAFPADSPPTTKDI